MAARGVAGWRARRVSCLSKSSFLVAAEIEDLVWSKRFLPEHTVEPCIENVHRLSTRGKQRDVAVGRSERSLVGYLRLRARELFPVLLACRFPADDAFKVVAIADGDGLRLQQSYFRRWPMPFNNVPFVPAVDYDYLHALNQSTPAGICKAEISPAETRFCKCLT